MGKSKRHYEDKHYQNKLMNLKKCDKIEPIRLSFDVKDMITNKKAYCLTEYWKFGKSTKLEIINVLAMTKCNKIEYVEWTLGQISDLFDFACKEQQINFVLFIVLNFKNKYYAKIKSGKIVAYADITSSEMIIYSDLHRKPLSDWWLKGFDICSQLTECVVCYEDTVDNVKTKCNHVFCRNCLGQHLMNKKDCPYCRTSLIGDRRGSSYDSIFRDSSYHYRNWFREANVLSATEFNSSWERQRNNVITASGAGNVSQRSTHQPINNYRLPVVITQPYNANYDGDEVNILLENNDNDQNLAHLTQQMLDSFHRAGTSTNRSMMIDETQDVGQGDRFIGISATPIIDTSHERETILIEEIY